MPEMLIDEERWTGKELSKKFSRAIKTRKQLLMSAQSLGSKIKQCWRESLRKS